MICCILDISHLHGLADVFDAGDGSKKILELLQSTSIGLVWLMLCAFYVCDLSNTPWKLFCTCSLQSLYKKEFHAHPLLFVTSEVLNKSTFALEMFSQSGHKICFPMFSL